MRSDEPRLFNVPSVHPLLLVVRPSAGGYLEVEVRRGWNPLTDGEPTSYEQLTVGEAMDVVSSTVWSDFAGPGPAGPG